MLNVQQYTALYQEAFANNPQEARNLLPEFNPQNAGFLGNRPTVDWQTPLLQKNAVIEDYSTKVYGGNESTNYYISAGYGAHKVHWSITTWNATLSLPTLKVASLNT
jgi:TonB-dependent starch-binding outer membrane protein SusC